MYGTSTGVLVPTVNLLVLVYKYCTYFLYRFLYRSTVEICRYEHRYLQMQVFADNR